MNTKKLENLIKNTDVFPDYVKNIYLEKIESSNYSKYWEDRVVEIIGQLDNNINASK